MVKTMKQHTIDRAVKYHLDNQIPFSENVFRPLSEMSNQLFCEAKSLYRTGAYTTEDTFERELLESDIGEFGVYRGDRVPLDIPLLSEESNGIPPLNKPKRGGTKKFYVYVKDPSSGNIKKVSFGGTTGLTVKINDPERRKSFSARHRCDDQNDKTSPAYWSCRLPYFAKSVGLSGGGNFFW